VHGHLTISDIIIHGSSESTLHGHKPKYILIVEAYYSSDGRRAYEIAPLASEPFVVTSVRVRSTRKKAIPHVDDDISKLKCLGHATQEKLRTLQDLVLRNPSLIGCPFHAINKVGEFRMLLSWSDENPKQCLALKKALNLTRGWDEARAHALSVRLLMIGEIHESLFGMTICSSIFGSAMNNTSLDFAFCRLFAMISWLEFGSITTRHRVLHLDASVVSPNWMYH
jgi:hypothetical protein